MNSVIGALRAVLGMDSTAFEKGVGQAQKQLSALNRSFQRVASDLDKLGSAMSIAITAPIVASGVAVTKAAADFEEGMNKVRAATGASADEMKVLGETAREIGKSAGFGAKESAEAMEALAKNGLNVEQILGGAAKAAVDLAAANGAQLEPAANVVTDTMQQFGKTAAELPGVVSQVTGTLIASKLGFDDYRLAIGQAGGVAGKLGVSFEDFNAAIAATSSSFASGSDAGTSFKTFLTRLVPQSDEAKDAMRLLGLSFFDGQGAMVGMEEQAARLQKALKGLSDKSKTDLVSKIFGTDAMRTALALADAGAEGIRKMRAEIDKTSASAQAAVRLEGLNGALRRLSASWENLSIAIGQSGLLEAATKLVIWSATMLDKLAALDPEVLKLATTIAAVAAATGPLLVAAAAIVSWLGQIAVWVGRVIPALAAVAAVAAPWAAAAVAIAAAAAAIVLFGDKIVVVKGTSITLIDAVRALAQAADDLASNPLIKWLVDLNSAIMPAEESTSLLGAGLRDVLSQDLKTFARNTASELDGLTNAFNATAAAAKTTFEIINAQMETWAAKARKEIGSAQQSIGQGIVDILNVIQKKLGSEPWPDVPPPSFEADSKAKMAAAGKSIAEAWNQAFTGNFFTEQYQRIAQQTLTNAMNRMIGQAQEPPPVTSADFGGKPKPPPGGSGGGGRNIATADSKGKSLAEALKRIEEEKKSLDAATAFLTTANKTSETLLFQAADELARIGAKTADLLKGLDPDSAIAKKIQADVTALEKARTAYTQLGDSIKYAFQIEGQYGNGAAAYTETMRQLNAALAIGVLSQQAYAAAAQAAADALVDQQLKAEGAKGGLEGFAAGIGYAAEQMARNNRPFEQGKAAFAELSSAFTEAGHSLYQLDADVGTILARLLQRLADFAFETLLMKPIFDAIGSMIKNAYSGGSAGGGGNLLGSIFSGIGAFLGFAGGGRPKPGEPYWVGENGPELRIDGPGAIIPNDESMKLAGAWYAGATEDTSRRSDGPLLTAAETGDHSTIQVVQNLNFAMGVQQTVRAEIRTMLPEIAKAGAAAAQSFRQRGGSYKESFQPQ